jgi:hypothetical protein
MGNYQEFLTVIRNGSKGNAVDFNAEKFINTKDPKAKGFFETFLNTQVKSSFFPTILAVV